MSIKKWLVLAVLAAAVGIPSAALAAGGAEDESCWCPICW
jgi:hypothetical protein